MYIIRRLIENERWKRLLDFKLQNIYNLHLHLQQFAIQIQLPRMQNILSFHSDFN